MVRTAVATCGDQGPQPSWLQDRRVPTIPSPSPRTFSRGDLEVGLEAPAGRSLGPCTAPHPRKARQVWPALICYPWSCSLGVGTRLCGS